jgi:hypothetical protein
MSSVDECSVAVCMVSRKQDGLDVGQNGDEETAQGCKQEISRMNDIRCMLVSNDAEDTPL